MNGDTPHVAILLCTYNGDRFLVEQLESIIAQKHQNFSIWASDDGSNDNTLLILEKYQILLGTDHFSILDGPQQGFAANFLSLSCRADIEADYIAFCDQDDIWEPDKLTRALTKLEHVADNSLSLYCSRTQLINDSDQNIGMTPLFNKPASFANALVQNIGGGNTMVMNKAAHALMRTAGEQIVVSHDWWAYILISGAGGRVIYDPYPTIQYRQHDDNKIGSNISWSARLYRISLLFKGVLRDWNSTHIQALQKIQNMLTPENKHIFDTFCDGRNRSLFVRIWLLKKSGIYRQTVMGNLGLIAASIFNRI